MLVFQFMTLKLDLSCNNYILQGVRHIPVFIQPAFLSTAIINPFSKGIFLIKMGQFFHFHCFHYLHFIISNTAVAKSCHKFRNDFKILTLTTFKLNQMFSFLLEFAWMLIFFYDTLLLPYNLWIKLGKLSNINIVQMADDKSTPSYFTYLHFWVFQKDLTEGRTICSKSSKIRKKVENGVLFFNFWKNLIPIPEVLLS